MQFCCQLCSPGFYDRDKLEATVEKEGSRIVYDSCAPASSGAQSKAEPNAIHHSIMPGASAQ